MNGTDPRGLPSCGIKQRHVRWQLELAWSNLDARERTHHPGAVQFYEYYGDNFKIECPTGSGKMMNLFEVAREISNRLARIFLRDEHGRRPVYGGTEKFQSDPYWRDYILFHEYFHGDNGAGLGASHQTGWTGAVARLIHLFGYLDPAALLAGGKDTAFRYQRAQDTAAD